MKTSRLVLCSIALGLAALLTGCATTPAAKTSAIFFPPPPDEPRIQYLTSFGSENELGGAGKFSDFVLGTDKVHRPIWKPYGITTAKGFIYICDTQPANIVEADLVKKRISYIRPGGREAMQVPINIAADAQGNRYVTDTKRGQVMVFDADDQLIDTIGKMGEMKPCGIALTAERLYIGDLSNRNVRVYKTATRELLFTIPRHSTNQHADIKAPTNLAVDKDGNLYVSDTGGFDVKVFDRDGKFIRLVGEMGLNAGRFALPKGIAVDREKRLYVVDAATAVVQMFDDQGRLLMFFGEPKSSGPAGLYLPAAITVDYENVEYFQRFVAPGHTLEYLILVTNQAGPNKVSVYGFVRKG
ncbi:MAG TPA: 6-bladed beta-propeller [Candidatus Acidoferrum sp.]|nr:6-bladed beta-propeller [Candidatus Acidoferrum sp.]